MSPTILVIGLDAADKDLLQQWAADGSLPNIAGLLKSSACGEMRSPPGQYAGSIWPSIFTGCSPARHGRYFFSQLEPGTYRYVPFRPTDLAEPPFWEYLSAAGKRCAIIDVPKAPDSASFNGIQLLDWGMHDPEFDHIRAYPSVLADEFNSRFGANPVPRCDHLITQESGIEKLRDALIERIEIKTRMVRHVLEQERWDLLMTVFADSHCGGHQLWAAHDPDFPTHDAELAGEIGDPLKSIYEAMDKAVGELLAQVNASTRVLLFTSHGMGAHYDGTFMLRDIVRRLRGSHVDTRNGPLELLRQAWRRLPRGLRRRSSGATATLRSELDVREMRDNPYFVVDTNDNCAGIRINLRGREPQGMVEPGDEYDALCAQVEQDLLALVNEDTGEPAVRAVLRSDQLFEGPELAKLPDLNVVWNRASQIRSVSSAKTGSVTKAFKGHRTGDHRSRGYLFARGPGIEAQQLAPVSAMDLAPTICAWLGVRLDVDGQAVQTGTPAGS